MADPDQRLIAPLAASVDFRAPSAPRLSPWLARLHKPAFILFLAAWALNVVGLVLRLDAPGRWTEGSLFVLAAVTSLVGLGRRLPFQNVATAGCLIFLLSGGVTWIGAASGVPFGPVVYSDRMGERLFDHVPWMLPFLWIAVVVNGRGIARLILRPWRKTNYYGFWVIGVTCLLAVSMALGLEPFAVFVRDYWAWKVTRSGVFWYTAPWINFLGWFTTTLGILAFTIPWLVNKHPIKVPRDYHPLAIWLLVTLWITIGNALQQLWPAVALNIVLAATMSVWAVRGARW